jgi:4'-phosphopantetheinyl transferase
MANRNDFAGLQFNWPEYLAPEELIRLDSISSALKKEEFALGRSILKMLLSHYIKRPAREIRIVTQGTSKPFINYPINFNIAHSRGHFVWALSRDQSIGVDIEYIRNRKNIDGLISETLCDNERRQISQSTREIKIESFYKAWTQKEALSKCLGLGLKIPFKELSIDLDLDTQILKFKKKKYSLYNLSAPANFSAGLALEGKCAQFNYHQFSDLKKTIAKCR